MNMHMNMTMNIWSVSHLLYMPQIHTSSIRLNQNMFSKNGIKPEIRGDSSFPE